jgi:glycosyltransferase involved in cell wall biosynthesis/phosphohistidine swiveling domain-containing protein
MLRTLVLVPIFNEEKTVKNLLEQIRENSSADILVVNDGSTDDSLFQAKKGGATYIINHDRNVGPGGALISGFKFAVEQNFDVLITLDGDGQHPPQFIPKFMKAINDVDMVVGSRYLPSSERRSPPPKDRELAIKYLRKLARKYIKYNVTDYASGFRAYRVSSLRKLRVTEKGYAWPFQLWVQAYAAGFKVKEIPIPLLYLDYNRGFHGEFHSMKEAISHIELVMKEEVRKSRNARTLSEKTVRWTRENVGEVIPDVITPLSWSILSPIIRNAFLHIYHQLGKSNNKTRFLDCFNGRVYINATAYKSILESLNPLKKGLNLSNFPLLVWSITHFGWLMLFLPIQIKKSLKTVPQEINKLRKLNLKALSSNEILNRIENLRTLLTSCMKTHLVGSMIQENFTSLLRNMIQKWGGSHSTIPYSVLLTGLTGMRSAKPGIELWKLSKKASTNNKIRKIILEREPSEILRVLDKDEDGKRFASEIKSFIDEYGSFSLQEFELSYPRWENDPTYVLKTMKNYLLPGNLDDPLDFESKQNTVRLRTTQEIRREFLRSKRSYPFKRVVFDKILFETQRYVVWRENMKQDFVLAYSQLSAFYTELASRFVKCKLLEEEGDVYFLTTNEIQQVADGKIKSETIDKLVCTRKQEREENRRLDTPKIIEVGGEVAVKTRENMDEKYPMSSLILKGVGCSVGRTTGKAQVVLDPATSGKFEKGGILVAPFTSPSWTPLFLIARAIITEVGGATSHGAIVAREYGLPCITNVKDATKLIKNGEILTVDGEQGVIYIGSGDEARKG